MTYCNLKSAGLFERANRKSKKICDFLSGKGFEKLQMTWLNSEQTMSNHVISYRFMSFGVVVAGKNEVEL